MPKVNGTLNYAVSAGFREIFGYTQTVSNVTDGTVSANVGFISPSIRMPTTVAYTGGYLATTGNSPSAFFHDFSISQVFSTRKFRFTATDDVRYLPDTPFSNIAGVVGVGTTVGVPTTQGAIIQSATRIENSSDGNASYALTGKTSIDGTALYGLERFPGYVGGIQTNTLSFDGGVTHQITPLESWGVKYSYTNFSYLSVTGTFSSQGGTLSYKRALNRKFSVNLAAGPQYIGASALTNRPASFNYNADLSATYTGSLDHAVVITGGYKRATNGGSGLTFGATTDTFSGTGSTRITRSLFIDVIGTYARSSGLQLITATQINTQTAIGSIQANRAFTRTISAYVSYSALHQAVQGLYTGPSPLVGLQQVLGFGATYSPSSIHLGR